MISVSAFVYIYQLDIILKACLFTYSGTFYVLFVLVLGSVTERWALQSDYMIAEKVGISFTPMIEAETQLYILSHLLVRLPCYYGKMLHYMVLKSSGGKNCLNFIHISLYLSYM